MYFSSALARRSFSAVLIAITAVTTIAKACPSLRSAVSEPTAKRLLVRSAVKSQPLPFPPCDPWFCHRRATLQCLLSWAVVNSAFETRREVTVQIAPVRILLVDDYEPWRRFLRLALLINTNLEIVEEVGDGVRAVTKAEELKPDLILLDIGLPILNGIDAALRIRQVAPMSKILFVSENCEMTIAEAGLRAGGSGYLAKSDCATELLAAIRTVLQDEKYLSTSLHA